MLLIGTSAVVRSTAALSCRAKQNGVQIVEIDTEQTFPDADFFIAGKAGTALHRLTEGIKVLAEKNRGAGARRQRVTWKKKHYWLKQIS